MKYDAVLFDLDGTVIDSLQDITDAVNHTMEHFGLPAYSPQFLRPRLGWGVGTLMRSLLPRLSEEELAEILAFYRPYYARHAADKSRPFPDILPTLELLKTRGLALAIISNKPDSAVQPLAERYFSGLMSLSVGELEGIRRKPEPDMLRSAAASLDVDIRRCLYVGDTEVDIQTARNTGIDCLCVTWGFRNREELLRAGAVHIVNSPREMADFVLNS